MSSLRTSSQVITPVQSSILSVMLSAVIIAGGTYFMYQFLFSRHSDGAIYGTNDPKNGPKCIEDEEEGNAGYKLRIFFGSQSGTAEGFAFDMQKETKKLGFNAKVIDLDDYNPDELCKETLAVFIVATYGEGEATDNAQAFYDWLTSENERNESELVSLEFAVFGLGNSQYEFYNAMGKQFDHFLEQYGATRIFNRGESDDDIGSIEDQFSDWKQNLYHVLCSKYLGMNEIASTQVFERSLSVEILPSSDAAYTIGTRIKQPYDLANYISENDNGEIINKSLFLPTRHKPYSDRVGICRLLSKTELRQNNNDGSTLHIQFDLTYNANYNSQNPVISYQTADNIGFIARNSVTQVDALCKRLKLNKKDVLHIGPRETRTVANYPFPQIVSIENLLLWFLDINGAPSKKQLSTFAQNFTKDVSEKESLMKLSENVQENVVDKHWTLLDVLDAYPSIEIDIGSLIELLKPLQPRLYTISSSSNLNPNVVSICIKLEKKERKEDNETHTFKGVQSNYFMESTVGNMFQIYVETSKFKLPMHSVPVIMIAVGAGLAPFAAFIDEADATIQSSNKICKEDYAEWWLFFGCRHQNGDYIYKDKLERSYKSEDGVLDGLELAFSRDHMTKVYVQHLIEANKEKLWQLIHGQHARIYVCGGVAMGRAVRETFIQIFEVYHESKDGHEYLDNMLKHDVYVQELWG
eukprot:261381_1